MLAMLVICINSSINSVEEIHSVGTINNVETSYFTQLCKVRSFYVSTNSAECNKLHLVFLHLT